MTSSSDPIARTATASGLRSAWQYKDQRVQRRRGDPAHLGVLADRVEGRFAGGASGKFKARAALSIR
jgi:hypothetical protein